MSWQVFETYLLVFRWIRTNFLCELVFIYTMFKYLYVIKSEKKMRKNINYDFNNLDWKKRENVQNYNIKEL